MVKILYIVSTLKAAGPTNQLLYLIKYLDRTRFIPYLVTLSSEPKNSLWADYEAMGIKMQSLNLSRMAGLFLAKTKIKRLIRSIMPDLIHTQGIRADILSASLSVNIPKICTIRNIPQEDYPSTYNKAFAMIMLRKHIVAMNNMNACVGVSRAVCHNLQRILRLNNSLTIFNGVDTQLYNPVQNSEKILMRKLVGFPLEGLIWIVSGHLTSLKNPIFLIRAWKHIFGFNNNSNHLVLLGGGVLEGECRAEVGACRNIHIFGQVDNVSNYLRAGDYYVSASKSEGLPNAVLEAMACGLPIFLSDIPSHREISDMLIDGGVLFESDDLIDFKSKLIRILALDYTKMSDSVIDAINRNFNAQKMSLEYQDLYENLLPSLSSN